MMMMMMQAGCIPSSNTQSIGGSWSALTNAGEATNLNLAHVMEVANYNYLSSHLPYVI